MSALWIFPLLSTPSLSSSTSSSHFSSPVFSYSLSHIPFSIIFIFIFTIMSASICQLTCCLFFFDWLFIDHFFFPPVSLSSTHLASRYSQTGIVLTLRWLIISWFETFQNLSYVFYAFSHYMKSDGLAYHLASPLLNNQWSRWFFNS